MATSIPRPSAWQFATVVNVRQETPRVKTIRFSVSDWPGHVAGQHADVRLTDEGGYRAERSYSIASPPEDPALELTVERLNGGEVSPYLTERLRAGDTLELRGPIGRHFAWAASERQNPLFLIGGGSGIVPLMCILRHRNLSRSPVPVALLYSARTREDLIYHDELLELARRDAAFTLRLTLTSDHSPSWSGAVGRIDLQAVRSLLQRVGSLADAFVCGRATFVEAASDLLVQAGHPPSAIRTERFGPTGID